MKKLILALVFIVLCSTGYSQELLTTKDVPKILRSQTQINLINNKMMHNLSGLILEPKIYYRQNFSYCDFTDTIIYDCDFVECNFSMSEGLDKAITNEATRFHGGNYTGADLPKKTIWGNPNTTRLTPEEKDANIKELLTVIEAK